MGPAITSFSLDSPSEGGSHWLAVPRASFDSFIANVVITDRSISKMALQTLFRSCKSLTLNAP